MSRNLVWARNIVGRDSKHAGAGLLKRLSVAGEVDRLERTARRIGARIEKDDQLAAGEIGKTDVEIAVSLQREIRRPITVLSAEVAALAGAGFADFFSVLGDACA